MTTMKKTAMRMMRKSTWKHSWPSRDVLLKRLPTAKTNLLRRSKTLALLSNSNRANLNNNSNKLSLNNSNSNSTNPSNNNSNSRTNQANSSKTRMDRARINAERTRTREATNIEQQ